MADWYYIGHYGQLGPLYREQIDDLISGGVIAPDTYVWKVGMSNWQPASEVAELKSAFSANSSLAPPPPPSPSAAPRPPSHLPGPAPYANPVMGSPTPSFTPSVGQSAIAPVHYPHYLAAQDAPKSDRSRIAAGILNIFLPGIGRIYLGYSAYGVLQLVVSICTFGVGAIWPFIDGILMLAGTPKLDGFGRRLDN